MLHSLVSFIVMLKKYSFDAHLFELCGLLVLFMVGTAENPWFLNWLLHPDLCWMSHPEANY